MYSGLFHSKDARQRRSINLKILHFTQSQKILGSSKLPGMVKHACIMLTGSACHRLQTNTWVQADCTTASRGFNGADRAEMGHTRQPAPLTPPHPGLLAMPPPRTASCYPLNGHSTEAVTCWYSGLFSLAI